MLFRISVLALSMLLSSISFANPTVNNDTIGCVLSADGDAKVVELRLLDLDEMYTGAQTGVIKNVRLGIKGDCLNHDCQVTLRLHDIYTLRTYKLTDLNFDLDKKGRLYQKKWRLSASKQFTVTCYAR